MAAMGRHVSLRDPCAASSPRDRVSLFNRPPAGVADAVALDPDRSAAHPQGLALRRGEPLADQVGQRVDGEAIGEQSPFGVAAWTAGEELQHLGLFRAEAHGRQVFSKWSPPKRTTSLFLRPHTLSVESATWCGQSRRRTARIISPLRRVIPRSSYAWPSDV